MARINIDYKPEVFDDPVYCCGRSIIGKNKRCPHVVSYNEGTFCLLFIEKKYQYIGNLEYDEKKKRHLKHKECKEYYQKAIA